MHPEPWIGRPAAARHVGGIKAHFSHGILMTRKGGAIHGAGLVLVLGGYGPDAFEGELGLEVFVELVIVREQGFK